LNKRNSIEKSTNATKFSTGCADALSDLVETDMQNNTLLKNIQKNTAWMTVAIGAQ
jgi:Sec7-like guanine-nucleotide exchange factor